MWVFYLYQKYFCYVSLHTDLQNIFTIKNYIKHQKTYGFNGIYFVSVKKPTFS